MVACTPRGPRRNAARALALCLASLALAQGALAQGDEIPDWPGWRAADGNGGWNAPPFPATWPGGELPVVWKQPVGPGYSGIAVASGRLFTQDRSADGTQERVLCFAAETGKPLWQHAYEAAYGDLDYGKGPRATPLVYGGRVYTCGAVGHLRCLDADTGRLVWQKDAKADLGARTPMWGHAASPIVYQDRLIVHIGAADGCFVALHPATGEVLWKGATDECGYATPIIVQHHGRALLLGWTPEHVLGLDPENGRLLWQIPYKVTYGVAIASPIFRDGIVFVSGYWEGSRAIRLGETPEQADLVWEENRQLRGLMSQPLFRDGFVYLLDKQHGVVCFELATGKVAWTDKNQLTPAGRNPHASLVWAGPDVALALNSDGQLVLARFHPGGFSEIGRSKIVGETWAHPAFCGRWVFARDDEQLVCVRLVP